MADKAADKKKTEKPKKEKAAPKPKKAESKKEVKAAKPPKPIQRQPVRLYTKAVFTGFRKNLRNHHPSDPILKLEGVNSREETDFYLGKRVAYIYRAKTEKDGSRFRVIWGRIRRPHGGNGSVRAKFRTNLPARAMGATLRVMLYPSRV